MHLFVRLPFHPFDFPFAQSFTAGTYLVSDNIGVAYHHRGHQSSFNNSSLGVVTLGVGVSRLCRVGLRLEHAPRNTQPR
jgi:hypothetical protein